MQIVHDIRVNREVVKVTSIHESDEKAYWLAQTPEARLEAMEMMRQVAYGYDDNSARLQRVFETAERE